MLLQLVWSGIEVTDTSLEPTRTTRTRIASEQPIGHGDSIVLDVLSTTWSVQKSSIKQAMCHNRRKEPH